MIRLESVHKPLVGMSGAALASIPLLILLFFLLATFHPQPPAVPVQIPAAPVVAVTPEAPAATPLAPTVRVNPVIVESRSPKVVAGRVTFSLKWAGADRRRKISGNIPRFPPDVSRDALVRVELVISAAGVIRSASVLESGNSRCADVTIRELRLWKFEPLARQRNRTDQRCIVTVSFVRKTESPPPRRFLP